MCKDNFGNGTLWCWIPNHNEEFYPNVDKYMQIYAFYMWVIAAWLFNATIFVRLIRHQNQTASTRDMKVLVIDIICAYALFEFKFQSVKIDARRRTENCGVEIYSLIFVLIV